MPSAAKELGIPASENMRIEFRWLSEHAAHIMYWRFACSTFWSITPVIGSLSCPRDGFGNSSWKNSSLVIKYQYCSLRKDEKIHTGPEQAYRQVHEVSRLTLWEVLPSQRLLARPSTGRWISVSGNGRGADECGSAYPVSSNCSRFCCCSLGSLLTVSTEDECAILRRLTPGHPS